MILFPNAKINLGLYVLGKRSDGYHEIRSIFYPIPLSDAAEFIAHPEGNSSGKTACNLYGFGLYGDGENLLTRAYGLLKNDFGLPPLAMSLCKNIPVGAGLGGGSADGTFMLKALDRYFSLGIDPVRLANYALELGSDCPFFLWNRPALVSGRGEIVTPCEPVLEGWNLLLVFPGIRTASGEAYSAVECAPPFHPPESTVKKSVENWRELLVNRFEAPAIRRHPRIGKIRDRLYGMGAAYASMTGSGSAVYGLFKDRVQPPSEFGNYFCWQGRLE